MEHNGETVICAYQLFKYFEGDIAHRRKTEPMTGTYSRRSLLAAGMLTALSGCLGDTADDREVNGTDSDTDGSMSDDADDGADEESASSGDSDEVPTSSGDSDGVPDGVPLYPPLPELVEASDREAVANEHDIEYRDGAVKVQMELTPDGERPDEYLVEVTVEFQRWVSAFVAVDDLVALANDDNVRFVHTTGEPKTHSE